MCNPYDLMIVALVWFGISSYPLHSLSPFAFYFGLFGAAAPTFLFSFALSLPVVSKARGRLVVLLEVVLGGTTASVKRVSCNGSKSSADYQSGILVGVICTSQ